MTTDRHDVVESVAEAMATTFRIHIAGWDGRQARQAAAEAFEELGRLERLLSRFIDGSDVDRINKAEPEEPVRVRADTFECLKISLAIEQLTAGAFNIAVGSDLGAAEPAPSVDPANLVLRLNEAPLTVALTLPDIRIDLGGVGKGFAVDAMIACLKEWEVPAALVDAGGSTTFAYSLYDPPHSWTAGLRTNGHSAQLNIHEFGFAASGTSVKGRHIFDGRTGRSVAARTRTWARAPRAAEADALSTAFFVMDDAQIDALCENHPQIGAAWCVVDGLRELVVHTRGTLSGLSWIPPIA